MRVIFAVVALSGLLIDQLAKIIAVRLLDPQDPPVLFGGLLTLRLIRNPGAAFSMGEGFTIVFAVLAIGVLAYVLIKLAPTINHPGWAVALGLLVAGVSGNLMDRIFREPSFLHGHVVDFFQLPHFAIFNVADVCITSAAVLIMILAIVKNVGIDGTRYVRKGPEETGPEGTRPEGTGPEGTRPGVQGRSTSDGDPDTGFDAAPALDESVERPDRDR